MPDNPILCTLDQVKSRIGISGTNDDTLITSLISAVNKVAMVRYGREFVPQTASAARTFEVRSRLVNLNPYDLRTVASVVLHPEASSPTTLTVNVDYALKPLGADPLTGTYLALKISEALSITSEFSHRFGVAQLQITGAWGIWNDVGSVPADINEAAIETVLSWLDRPAEQVAGIAELGQPHRALTPTAQGWDIPMSAHRKFMPYSRNLGVY